jgi:hypothetical protein
MSKQGNSEGIFVCGFLGDLLAQLIGMVFFSSE